MDTEKTAKLHFCIKPGLYFPYPAFDAFETHLQDTKSILLQANKWELQSSYQKNTPRRIPSNQPKT